MKLNSLLLSCHWCKGSPKLFRVGDNKEYLVYMCSKCYKTPVHIDEASLTPAHAARMWNTRTMEELNKRPELLV